MSERHINDPQSTPEASASVGASALASARRRRFIKMSSGVVPVAMTLASRPVLATNCVTASAWGSAVGAAGTLVAGTSAYTRSQKKLTPISGTQPLTEWTKGLPNCTSWKNAAIGCTSQSMVQAYTLQSLCGGGILGYGSTSKVWSILTLAGTDETTVYKRTVIVAWLNLKISTSVGLCVKDTLRPTYNALWGLSNLAAGSIGSTGPDGKNWTQAAATNYLRSNFLSL